MYILVYTCLQDAFTEVAGRSTPNSKQALIKHIDRYIYVRSTDSPSLYTTQHAVSTAVVMFPEVQTAEPIRFQT